MRLRAIVFDLDDTLYPEREYVLSGFRAVAAWAEEELNRPADEVYGQLKRLFEQGVRGDTFNRWLHQNRNSGNGRGPRPAPDALVSQMVRLYREHQPQLKAFPEVPEILASLSRRYRLGLVSDGPLAAQRRKLAALRLEDYFEAIVFSDELGNKYWKPHPKAFQVVLNKLKVEPHEAIYIADNPLKDFLGAREAGLLTAWVRRAGGEYSRLSPPTQRHAPDMIVPSLWLLGGFSQRATSR